MSNLELITKVAQMNGVSEDEKLAIIGGLVGGKAQKGKAQKAEWSVNGAAPVEEIEVKEKEGYLFFSAKGFKSGRKNGYAIADVKTAKQMFDAGQSTLTHKMGTKGVSIYGGGNIFENLVLAAEKSKLI